MDKLFGLHSRSDTQFAVMRCARCSREPATRDWGASVLHEICNGLLPRLSRSRQRCFFLESHHVSRRSCSGGLLAVNDAVITSCRRPPSLSSSEAELDAIGAGFVETWFVTHFLEKRGHDVRAEVRTDSRVSRTVVFPQGLRKMKHIELRFLFFARSDETRRDLDLVHRKQAQPSRHARQTCHSPAFGTLQADARSEREDERQRCPCRELRFRRHHPMRK